MARILLYVPNLIGYFRLVILVFCWYHISRFYIFIPLYSLQVLLDGEAWQSLIELAKFPGIDGCLARRLNQCSSFGAWLDVVVDNVGRTILWTGIYRWGIFVACLEWVVFVCTHNLGPRWKEASLTHAPSWVVKALEKNFKTVPGGFMIAGLHILPIYMYIYYQWEIIPFLGNLGWLLLVPIVVLVPARVYCLGVELWFIHSHVRYMIQNDEVKTLAHSASDLNTDQISIDTQ